LVGLAGIDLDPAVVNAFLSLEGVTELNSFAKPAAEVIEDPGNARSGWNMFSELEK
jgi:hypothetical protein